MNIIVAMILFSIPALIIFFGALLMEQAHTSVVFRMLIGTGSIMFLLYLLGKKKEA